MALNTDLDASFGNMQDWKGIREKAREVNTRKASVDNDEISRRILNWWYTGNHSIEHTASSFLTSWLERSL
jgi:hypothetical protein